MKISATWHTLFRGRRQKPNRPRRLTVEALEPRQLLATIQLTATADDTLYQNVAGNLSNGLGQHFYVGTTSQAQNNIRRGAVKFDLAAVPVGAAINGVTLTLNMSRTPNAAPQNVSLHRVSLDWGEGTSNAALGGTGSGEGDGIQATTGDVTWVYTFFNTKTWLDMVNGHGRPVKVRIWGEWFVQSCSSGWPTVAAISYITRECGIVFPKFPMKQDEFIQGANCMASRE
jgi:hypothetical protein